METKDHDQKVNELVERALADGGFREQLSTDLAGTLQAAGIELPPGLQVKVLELIAPGKCQGPRRPGADFVKEAAGRGGSPASAGPLGPGDLVGVSLADACPACGGMQYNVHLIFETGCGIFACTACQQARWITGLEKHTLGEENEGQP